MLYTQSSHITDYQSGAEYKKFHDRDQHSNHYATPLKHYLRGLF